MRPNPQPKAPDRLAIPTAELAERLAICERHLQNLDKAGRLGPQPLAFGRSKRWSVAEVEAWLAAGAPDRETWQAMRAGSATESPIPRTLPVAAVEAQDASESIIREES